MIVVTFQEGECHGKKESPGTDLILGHDSRAGRVEITSELFDQGEVESWHLDELVQLLPSKRKQCMKYPVKKEKIISGIKYTEIYTQHIQFTHSVSLIGHNGH